jgi:hypothetical protein
MKKQALVMIPVAALAVFTFAACGADTTLESSLAPTIATTDVPTSTPGLPIGAGDKVPAISPESIPANGVLEVTLGGPDGINQLELSPRMTVTGLDESIVFVKTGTPVTLFPLSPGVTTGDLYVGDAAKGKIRVTVEAAPKATGGVNSDTPAPAHDIVVKVEDPKHRVVTWAQDNSGDYSMISYSKGDGYTVSLRPDGHSVDIFGAPTSRNITFTVVVMNAAGATSSPRVVVIPADMG